MSADPPPDLLQLVSATRTYDDGQPVYALRETTLTIRGRDFVTITGPSGSGKSTLLNLLGLLDRPSSGRYHVSGTDMSRASEGSRSALRGQLFGFVFQSFHLLPGRTAIENVELGMLYGPRRHPQRRALAIEALDRMGLSVRARADPRQLSGGERQRVAIARAIAGGPLVLFCDEPTGNLDSANSDNVLALLSDLNHNGLAVIIVTHDQEVAARGRRRLRVADGRVSEGIG